MKEVIKNLLVANLEHMDVLSENINNSRQEIVRLLDNIITADIKGANADEFYNKQRIITAKNYLMEQDLAKVMDRITMYYKLAQSTEGELGLSKEDEDRVSHIASQESFFFVVEKEGGASKLKARDENIMNTLEAKVLEQDNSSFKSFLTNMRDSEMYKKKKDSMKDE